MNGHFIVFEGGEGCGKSTQAEMLATKIGGLLTRQPGGTAIGGALRAILLDPLNSEMSPRAEALLMAADRAQHADEIIRPTLDGGRHVVCDRYTYSSVAYQGFGRQLDPERIRAISAWGTGELWPDLVVLLDLEPERAHERLTGDRDRFEQADTEFHRRVRDGFLTQAADDPDRWVVVDAAQSVEAVNAQVWATVSARLDGVQPVDPDE